VLSFNIRNPIKSSKEKNKTVASSNIKAAHNKTNTPYLRYIKIKKKSLRLCGYILLFFVRFLIIKIKLADTAAMLPIMIGKLAPGIPEVGGVVGVGPSTVI